MNKKLEFLITSGGTVCKIDDVRHIGNFSNGYTGATLAEYFLEKGHRVHYLYSKYSKRPFKKDMVLDLTRDFDCEIMRLKELYNKFGTFKDSLKEYEFFTFDDYYNSVRKILQDNRIDVSVFAAAVSDYGVKKVEGKISSEKDLINIQLTKNPKIISLAKTWNPGIYQVGFKLLINKKNDELIRVGKEHGKNCNSDLTVANSINGGAIETAIIDKRRDFEVIRRADLPEKLYGFIMRDLKG